MAQMTYQLRVPACTAANWIAFSAMPPVLAGQLDTKAYLVIDGASSPGGLITELSDQHRQILSSAIDVSGDSLLHELTVHVLYRAQLVPRQIARGKALDVDALPPDERLLFLQPSETLNYSSIEFQQWLTNLEFRRRPDERDVDFAWRIFLALRQRYNYKYIPSQDRTVSVLCNESATDCGGLSVLLISILRANQIPARALVGRWATPTSPPHKLAHTYDYCHVKAEFYADGVGWIPVDLSAAVTNKSADTLEFFGCDQGDFLTLHLDPDIRVDTIWFGEKTCHFMQSPAIWMRGRGVFKDETRTAYWEVERYAR